MNLMRKQNSRTHRVSTKVITWVLTFVMLLSLIPFGTIQVAEAAELLTQEDLQDVATDLWKDVVANDYLQYDTNDRCGGSSHMQGICIDDEGKYMYFSYTSVLAKVDMATGKVVASVGGFGEGSFGASGGAHLGCLDYYDGWVYGSLEYKDPGKKFFICAFDTSRMTEVGVDVDEIPVDENGHNGVTGILLYEPTMDFRDGLSTELFGSQDKYGEATNNSNNGHRFACSGIDGVTFGTMPGDTSGKIYLIVAYGIYSAANFSDPSGTKIKDTNRLDNAYNVLQFYDVEDFWDGEKPVGTQNILFNCQRGLSRDYAENEILKAADTLYVFTGATSWGSQNLEWEADTGDIVLYTYGNQYGMPGPNYVVDGSKAPVTQVLELGQNNTISDAEQSAYAKQLADCYSTDANGDGVIQDSERLTGKVAVMKCVCGNPSKHDAATVGDETWSTTGVKKADALVCGVGATATPTEGIAWVGNDGDSVDYFYIRNGNTSAGLYKRTTNANGSFTWSRVTSSGVKKQLLVDLSMDTADLYEKDGVVYMKNKAEGYTDGQYDAVVEGTTSGKGVQGGDGSALSFDAWQYPDRVDQVKLNSDTISLINNKIKASEGIGAYSYSVWVKQPTSKNSDGNFIPFVGFYREDGTYASVFEMRWRNAPSHVTNGIGDAAPGAGNISGDPSNPSNKDPGDAQKYLFGYQTAPSNPTDWHLYTVTESAGEVTIYFDGQQIKTKTVAEDHLKNEPFVEFIIGGGMGKVWQDMNNRGRFIGEVDEVKVWSGVLTADEVAALYAAKPANAATNPAHPGVDTTAPAESVFAPAYPAYDLTDDAGKTLEVTAAKDVAEVFTLDNTKVAISGKKLTFAAAYLATLETGKKNLTVKFTDNTTETLTLTVTDREVPVLNYNLSKASVSGNTVKDSGIYGVDAYTTVTKFTASHNGASGGSMVFDGYDYDEPTYVKMTDEGADWLNSVLKNGYSINFWARADAENGNKMVFGGFYGDDARPLGVVETNDGNGKNDKIDGKLELQLDVAKNGTQTSQAAKLTNTVDKEIWVMYTATYDKASGTTKLYAKYGDTTETVSGTVADDIIGNIGQLFIGHQYQKYYYNNTSATSDWTTRGGFYGAISDVSVYNYALSETEINVLFESGSITPAQKTKPLIHWTLDANTLSGDGTILESANGYESYYQNVTPVAGVDGKEGGALYFDGAADSGEWSRVWLGDEGIEALNEDITNQVTMTFWMKADKQSTNEQLAYTAAWSPVAGIYGTDTRFLMVTEYRSGRLNYCATIPGLSDQRIQNFYNAATGGSKINSSANPAHDEWCFVVMTWDGETTETVSSTSSTFRRMYIFKSDGTIVYGRPDRAAKSTLEATQQLFDEIGMVELGGQNSKGFWSDTNVRGRFVGALDDVKVYNVPFTVDDAETMFNLKPATNNELYLPSYQFEVKVTDTADLTFDVENAGALTAVSGLAAGEFSMADGEVTLDHDALISLGFGYQLLDLTFANGTRTIRIHVVDDRVYFDEPVVFDKATATEDAVIQCKTATFGVPKTVVADDLTDADYTISGNKITVSKDWLMRQQPGAVAFTVTSTDSNVKTAYINVINSDPEATYPESDLPYPILYYAMDKDDINEGKSLVHGAVTGTIADNSGNGIDLLYGGITKTDKNKDGAADSAAFFDGYRDFDVSRAWLDDNGINYLNDLVDDEITFSFWHNSPRITGNYMPVLGVFAENDRPLLLAEFRYDSSSSRGERTGSNQNTAPSVFVTPDGSLNHSDTASYISAANVKMNSTWHHYVVTYNQTTGDTTLYVDGALAKTAALAKEQLDDIAKFEIGGVTNASYYNIGSNNLATYSIGRLYGNLDEIKVYNAVLTADEVAELYADGVSTDYPFDMTGIPTNITDDEGDALLKNGDEYSYGYVESPAGPVEGAAFSFAGDVVTVTLPDGYTVNDGIRVVLTGMDGEADANVAVNIADTAQGSRTGKTTDAEGEALYLIPAAKLLAAGTGVDKVYDGEAAAPAVTALMGAKKEYSADNGTTWTETAPSFTDVTNTTVLWRVTKDWYETAEGSVTVKITDATIQNYTITANAAVKYDGEAHVSATVSKGIPADAVITYSYGANTYSEVPSFTEVGTYEVSYTISKANYADVTGTYSFTIEKGDLTGYAVTAKPDAKFDGSAKVSAVVTEGTPAGAAVTFTCGSGSYNEVPEFTAVGEYTVNYTISKPGYNDVTGSYTFTIVKGDITGYDIVANDTAKYDGTEKASATVTEGMPADAEITYTYGNDEYDSVPKFTEIGEYTVSYVISKEGYNDVTGEYTFEIEEGEILDFEIEANEPVVYDGEAHVSGTVTPGIPADAKITYFVGNNEYDEVPSFTDAGTYTVSYVISKDGYNDVDGEYTFTIEKAEIEVDMDLFDKAEATGKPVPAAKVNSISEGAYPWFAQFKDKDAYEAFKDNPQPTDSPFSEIFEPGEIPAFTEPGIYYLAVYCVGENYEPTEIEIFAFELTEPAPETGDTFNMGLWLAVAALSAAAGIILVLRRRKEQA